MKEMTEKELREFVEKIIDEKRMELACAEFYNILVSIYGRRVARNVMDNLRICRGGENDV